MSSSRKENGEIRMIMIGKTGSGKSRTGNSILGKQSFEFGNASEAVTSICALRTANRDGYKIDLVDTPGVFDVKRSMEDIKQEVKKSMVMTSPGPHAVLLCVTMSRFAKDDIETLNHYLEFFGEEMLKITIVLFTKVDIWEMDLMDKQQTMSKEEYIAELPERMRDFLSKCNDQYIFVNNRQESPEHPQQVISKVLNMRRSLPNPYFTNESFEKIEERIEEVEKQNPKIDREEIKQDEGFWGSVYGVIKTVCNPFNILKQFIN